MDDWKLQPLKEGSYLLLEMALLLLRKSKINILE